VHEGERPDYDRQEEPLGGPVVPINALRATPAPADGALLALRRGPGFPILSGPELARVLETALGGGRPVPHGPARLAARDPASDLELGDLGWLGLAWPAAEVLELEGDRRRPSTLTDLREATRLADALPQVGVVAAAVRALDVDPGLRPLRELQALLAGTTKHVQIEVPPDEATAEALLEIARAPGAEPDRPAVSALLDVEAIDEPGRIRAAGVLAGAGVPIGLAVRPAVGALEETLGAALGRALRAAGDLANRAPGVTVFLVSRALGAGPDGVPAGAHAVRFLMAFVQAARELGLPAAVEALATGSRASDWQAGMEGGLGVTACWMAGPDLVLGAGLRDAGRAFSPVGLLLDTEAFDLVRPIPLGFAVDEETLAVEVIEKVGPGGHFLGEPHTLRHMRETWSSRFMDRNTWEAWEERGRPEPPDHARERARELLAEERPPALGPEAEARIEEVIAAHGRGRR